MSEKKEKITAEAKKNKAPAKKKENPFKKVIPAIKKFFKDFKGEWKKITWPTGKTVLNSAIVVIVIVVIVGLAIWGFDTGLSSIINGLVNLADKQDAAATTEMIRLLLMK